MSAKYFVHQIDRLKSADLIDSLIADFQSPDFNLAFDNGLTPNPSLIFSVFIHLILNPKPATRNQEP